MFQVPFEDVRISKDQIPALKEAGKILYGNQVPTMEVDGKVVAQTGAIARYCGKQGGFYPRDDDLAAAKIDEIIDTATDITLAIGRTFGMADAEKMAARAVLGKETLPMYLKALEKIMTDNGSTGSTHTTCAFQVPNLNDECRVLRGQQPDHR